MADKGSKSTKQDSKKERLAQALRDNLKKRKAQTRERLKPENDREKF